MTLIVPPDVEIPADPTLEVAERQLDLLRELGLTAMVVSRAYAALAIASAEAAKAILTEEYFMPEVGRANACGAKDAAESYQKVTRAVRLTFMLEKATAEYVRNLRTGVTPPSAQARPVHGAKPTRLVIDETDAPAPPAPRPDADDEGAAARVERPGAEGERLFEIETPERLPKGLYTGLVDGLAADIGVTIDWDTATVSAPTLGDIAPPPYPTDPSEPSDALATARRELALSP